MSTDHMTKKQWEERNGKVMTYQLGKPMSWDEFRQMPANIQKEYLLDLIHSYSTTASDLARMFGITPQTVTRVCGNSEIGIEFHRGKRMSKEQRSEFEKFLGKEEAATTIVAEQQAERFAEQFFEQDAPILKPSSCADMTGFSMCFEGIIRPEMIMNSIIAMLRPDANVKLEIKCAILPDLA